MATADLTRQRLVRAALELFTSQGYHVTTTVQIARKAGVAEGTIYKHFESKQHLMNELYRGAARWAARAAEEADGREGPVRDRLQALAQRLVAGASQEPAVMQLYFVERHGGGGGSVLDDKSRESGREFHTALERLLARGKADGVIRPGAAEVWAGVWLGVVRQVLERVLTREWGESSPGVRQSIEAAWIAISR